MRLRFFAPRLSAVAVAALLAPGMASAQETAFEDFKMAPANQVPIVTPTRLPQAVRDIPATVTILTSETLATYGILSIPGALRMVEGSALPQLSWANYALKSGRRNSFGPPRVTLMIDGIEIDSSHFNENIDWGDLPVSIDDVERIEVTRGPSTAGYEHAMTTVVVNIVTKHPADVERGFARATFGSYQNISLFGRAGATFGPSAARLTLSHYEREPIDEESPGIRRAGTLQVDRMILRTSTRVDAATTLAIDAAYLDGKLKAAREVDSVGTVDSQNNNGYASAVWTRNLDAANELSVRLDHWFDVQNADASDCPSAALPASAAAAQGALVVPLAGAATAPCSTIDDDEHRTKLEVKDVHDFADGVRAVGGIGMRYEAARTSLPQSARWTATFARVFAGLDWRASPATTINAGFSADQASADDHDRSLRAAVNWDAAPDQTLRASIAFGDWASATYRTLNIRGNVVTREKTTSADVGYLLNAPARNASLNGRLFWVRMNGSIWAGTPVARAGYLDAHGDIYGVEMRASSDLPAQSSGYLGLSAGATGDTTATGMKTSDWVWGATGGLATHFGQGWQASINYDATSRVPPSTVTANTTGVTLLKDFEWLSSRARLALTGRYSSHVAAPTASGYRGVSSAFATLQLAF